jgi:hypothetical protein
MFEFSPMQFVQTLTGAAAGNGLVPSGAPDFVAQRGDKRQIVVAAAPRSGSTFLTNVLSPPTGLPYFRLCSAYSTNEHDLYLPAVFLKSATGCVSQLHMKGTFHNAAIARTFGIKPIISVRRIYDIIINLREDFRKKVRAPGYGLSERRR